jgi:hypothetical protein
LQRIFTSSRHVLAEPRIVHEGRAVAQEPVSHVVAVGDQLVDLFLQILWQVQHADQLAGSEPAPAVDLAEGLLVGNALVQAQREDRPDVQRRGWSMQRCDKFAWTYCNPKGG